MLLSTASSQWELSRCCKHKGLVNNCSTSTKRVYLAYTALQTFASYSFSNCLDLLIICCTRTLSAFSFLSEILQMLLNLHCTSALKQTSERSGLVCVSPLSPVNLSTPLFSPCRTTFHSRLDTKLVKQSCPGCRRHILVPLLHHPWPQLPVCLA